MSECQHVITELKKQLKLHGIQYQDIAYALNLSEGSVKRLLAEGSHISLERLATICQLIGMELTELFRLVADKQTLLSALTFEQEKQLVSDKALLLVAVCVGQWIPVRRHVAAIPVFRAATDSETGAA